MSRPYRVGKTTLDLDQISAIREPSGKQTALGKFTGFVVYCGGQQFEFVAESKAEIAELQQTYQKLWEAWTYHPYPEGESSG